MADTRYRGYQRCSRIDYGNARNLFVVTICVKPRRSVFVNANVNERIVSFLMQVQAEGHWGVHLYCLMPDHLHLVVRLSVAGLPRAVRFFKGRTATWWRKSGDGRSLWQSGYFDHLIRSEESLDEKCQYVLENPVRAGLVTSPEDYAWSGALAEQ